MKKTLLILAAGLGSRYGGLKQLDTFGPNGELLMEYGIYDAIEAGFTKIVFVIKRDIAAVFIPLMARVISDEIEVHFVFQEMDDLPKGFINTNRIKPWGTAHAIWTARNCINEPFLIMNADDFYGKNAYVMASSFFDSDSINFAVVSYRLGDTLSEYGGVNRGICFKENGTNNLKKIVEVKGIQKQSNNQITFVQPKELGEVLKLNELVSMNMFCLRPSFFPLVEQQLIDFLSKPVNLATEELLIPEVIEDSIANTSINTLIVNADSDWFGVTYKADRDMAVSYTHLTLPTTPYV